MKIIFLGYKEDWKAYQLYDPSIKKIIKSRDVYFKDEENPEIIEPTVMKESKNILLQKVFLQKDDCKKEDDSDDKTPPQQTLRRNTRLN